MKNLFPSGITIKKHHYIAFGLFVALGLFFLLTFSPFSRSNAVSIDTSSAPADAFHLVANSQGTGAVVATIVGPGPTEGSQRFYASYFYSNNTFDILAVNPDDGTSTVFHNPVAPTNGVPENGARNGAVVGPDGDIYFGTDPHAHFIRIDPKAGTIVDLGRPAKTELNMWNVGAGSDGKIYGVTYPNCKLVSYDPTTGKMEDLGRMDPTEKYGLTILGDADGWLYIGVGYEHANIIAYNIADHTSKALLSDDQRLTGQGQVYRGNDGNIYGTVNGIYNFRLENGAATLLTTKKAFPKMTPNVLSDGRVASITLNGAAVLTVTNPADKSVVTYPLDYNGADLKLFRIGFGPDNSLYGSTVLPLNLVKINQNDHTITQLGNLGQGEGYSLLPYNNALLIGAYGGLSPLMSYQPSNNVFSPSKIAGGNPFLISLKNQNDQWRPYALIEGTDGSAYMGSIASYGLLEAPLNVLNPDGSTAQYSILQNQSVVSLVAWGKYLIGGTTVLGGNGAHQVAPAAELFIWNTETHETEFDTVPVPGATRLTDLVLAPNGTVYGIAGVSKNSVLFEFDPVTKKIVATQPLPFPYPGDVIYNSAVVDSSGKIWGLEAGGLFTIDPSNDTLSIISSPYPITGGFAMKDSQLYFISNNAVYSYSLPESTNIQAPVVSTDNASTTNTNTTNSDTTVSAPVLISDNTVVPVQEVAPQPASTTAQGFWSFIPFINKPPKASVAVSPARILTDKANTTTKGKKSYDIISAKYTLNGVLVHTTNTINDGWKLDITSLQDGVYTLSSLYQYADGTTDATSNTFTVDNTPSIFERFIETLKHLLTKLK